MRNAVLSSSSRLRPSLALGLLLATAYCHSTGHTPTPRGSAGSGGLAPGSGGDLGAAGAADVGPENGGAGDANGLAGAGHSGAAGAAQDASCEAVSVGRAAVLSPQHASVDAWLSELSPEQRLEVLKDGGSAQLGLPAARVRGGPYGVSQAGSTYRSTTWAAPIARAAAFDVDLEYRVGAAQGAQMRAFKYDVALAPRVDVMRHPAFEGTPASYGEDALLVGELAASFVRGSQQHVPTCPSYFVAPSLYELYPGQIEEQPLWEGFLRAYEIVIEKADPACIAVDSHPLNGVSCTHDPYLLDQVLREEWQWQGFTMYGSTADQDALLAGLDFSDFGDLTPALGDDGVSERIEQAASRILNARARFSQHLDAYTESPIDEHIVDSEVHVQLARETALKGAVLLKNDGLLPVGAKASELASGLEEVTSILVMGPDADAPNTEKGLSADGPSATSPPYVVSFLEGLTARAFGLATVSTSSDVADAADADLVVIPVVSLQGPLEPNGFELDKYVSHWGGLTPSAYIQQVAAVNANVLVLLTMGSVVSVDGWFDDARAVVQTFYPGQEAGHAAAALIFGDENFSGKLPFAVAVDHYSYAGYVSMPFVITADDYHGYRAFEAGGSDVRFWFGYGQSYTSYEYANLSVLCPEGVSESGQLTVELDVTNTGDMAGEEIVQLYVGYPPHGVIVRPPKELKAFKRVALEPGQTKRVELAVLARDMRYWNAETHAWALQEGEHTVFVGPSADPAALLSAPFNVQ